MIAAASIKSKLKNLAKDEQSTMQNELITYALERTNYRMSISDYAERFTLKGGIFLYALFDRKYPRATMDIDFLANKLSNDSIRIKMIFKDIFNIVCDDALRFDLDTLEVCNITEFKDYHGVNVKITAFLERTKIPVSIDIGFGDVVYPGRMKMDFPVLLDMDSPKVYAYSNYSVIAEKFEAIVKTFNHRHTSLTDIVAFSDDYINDPTIDSKWKSFLRKKQVNETIDFQSVITQNKLLLLPIIENILNEHVFQKNGTQQ